VREKRAHFSTSDFPRVGDDELDGPSVGMEPERIEPKGSARNEGERRKPSPNATRSAHQVTTDDPTTG